MPETKEKYVTEEILVEMFDLFWVRLQKEFIVFRQEIRKEIQKDIHDAVDEAVNELGLLMLKHFNRIDARLDSIEERLADCVRTEDHRVLEKRVDRLEFFGKKVAN